MSNIEIMSESPGYLSINEQEKIITNLTTLGRRTPLRENIFFAHGDKLSACALIASGLVFWRAGFRAFNLHKYNKNRLITLGLTCATSTQGAVVHTMYVREKLTDLYRDENYWTYGIRSMLSHQVGLFNGLMCGVGMTFLIAHRMSILPIPEGMFRKGARKVAFDYFITKIKPYAKPIGITWIASTTFMFVVGICEYEQSRNLLAKLGRKTLCLRED